MFAWTFRNQWNFFLALSAAVAIDFRDFEAGIINETRVNVTERVVSGSAKSSLRSLDIKLTSSHRTLKCFTHPRLSLHDPCQTRVREITTHKKSFHELKLFIKFFCFVFSFSWGSGREEVPKGRQWVISACCFRQHDSQTFISWAETMHERDGDKGSLHGKFGKMKIYNDDSLH